MSPRTPTILPKKGAEVWSAMPATPCTPATPQVSWADVAVARSQKQKRLSECPDRAPPSKLAISSSFTTPPPASWSYLPSSPPFTPDLTSPLPPQPALIHSTPPRRRPQPESPPLTPTGRPPCAPWSARALPPPSPQFSQLPAAMGVSEPFSLSQRKQPFLPSPPPPGSWPQSFGAPLGFRGEDFDPNEGRFDREFCEKSLLGRGDFASVFRVKNRLDQHIYAVKVQRKQGRLAIEAAKREVFALAEAAAAAPACQHLVRYFNAWQEDGLIHIQTEFCEGGTLRERLERAAHLAEPCFGDEAVGRTLREVAAGLAALHSNGFAHLDVKPDNILFSQDRHKLADFGLVARVTPSAMTERLEEGDCRYLAREVLKGDFSDLAKADVFSLGLVCYELATNPEPLPRNGTEWQRLRDGPPEKVRLASLSDPLTELLLRSLLATAALRPASAELARAHLPGLAEVGLAGELQELRAALQEARAAGARSERLAESYRLEAATLKQQVLGSAEGAGQTMQFCLSNLGG